MPNGAADADERYVGVALELAQEAARAGDVPVGAVVTFRDAIVGRAANRTLRDQDPTAHAELLAIRAAAQTLGTWRLTDCSLYVTLEPCAMCAGAIVLARVDRVVFGAWDDKAGMAGSIVDLLRHPRLNHRPEVRGGVMAENAARVLQAFFALTRSAEVR
ncbi:MAG: tRNA adenosine(34) deaminase TadA [Gemmatimonadaceae bacterium]